MQARSLLIEHSAEFPEERQECGSSRHHDPFFDTSQVHRIWGDNNTAKRHPAIAKAHRGEHGRMHDCTAQGDGPALETTSQTHDRTKNFSYQQSERFTATDECVFCVIVLPSSIHQRDHVVTDTCRATTDPPRQHPWYLPHGSQSPGDNHHPSRFHHNTAMLHTSGVRRILSNSTVTPAKPSKHLETLDFNLPPIYHCPLRLHRRCCLPRHRIHLDQTIYFYA